MIRRKGGAPLPKDGREKTATRRREKDEERESLTILLIVMRGGMVVPRLDRKKREGLLGGQNQSLSLSERVRKKKSAKGRVIIRTTLRRLNGVSSATGNRMDLKPGLEDS